jgi:hypothetical protein
VTERRRWLLVLLGVLAACSDGGGDALPVRTAGPTPTAIDSALLAPLEGLGPCPSPPPPADVELPPGVLLPDGATVTSVNETGPLTNVQGFVPLTPVQVRVDYSERDDVEILTVEDEGFESEVLLSAGERRLFVKAQAICDRGSVFAAVLAPESAAAAVPTPSGAASR